LNDKPSRRKPVAPLLPPARPLMDTEQLAVYLGGKTSVRTLEDWRRLGIGPDFVTLSPKMVRYRPEVVDAWLDTKSRQVRAEVA
jgi:hypothetical protein